MSGPRPKFPHCVQLPALVGMRQSVCGHTETHRPPYQSCVPQEGGRRIAAPGGECPLRGHSIRGACPRGAAAPSGGSPPPWGGLPPPGAGGGSPPKNYIILKFGCGGSGSRYSDPPSSEERPLGSRARTALPVSAPAAARACAPAVVVIADERCVRFRSMLPCGLIASDMSDCITACSMCPGTIMLIDMCRVRCMAGAWAKRSRGSSRAGTSSRPRRRRSPSTRTRACRGALPTRTAE